MSPALQSTALLLAAFTLLASCRSAPAPAERPNVILISVDSLRADHLGCYGYARETSPFIDELAARGVRFESAISTTSWTLPAHAAMFTGLWDSTHRLVDNGLRLAEEHVTLAERFRQAGYHTAGFFGGPYLHPTFGLGQGFDVYRSCMTTTPDDSPGDRIRTEARQVSAASHDDVTGPRTVEEVTRWIGSRPTDRPFFLFLHLWDVHYDYVPPPEYVERFDPDYEGELTGIGFTTNPALRPDMPARDLQHLIALYDGEIRFTDDQLRTLFSRLRETRMLQNTVVVVTADHGEEFFEHGDKGHQRTLFDEVIRVPLIITWEGKLEPRTVAQQVRLVDLAPTLASLAGAEPPPEAQGRDLGPLLRGESLPPEPALSELWVEGRGLRALRSETEKVILPRDRLPETLFDLVADPLEQSPIERGAPQEQRRRRAAEALHALSEEARAAGAAGPGALPHRSDEGMRERLRSLGYIE